ncbi:MAG: hypothetical protein JWQ62_2895 [Lacunisphaera sp.]|nr:hypothetical protein [Lacunisphaera sp.]
MIPQSSGAKPSRRRDFLPVAGLAGLREELRLVALIFGLARTTDYRGQECEVVKSGQASLGDLSSRARADFKAFDGSASTQYEQSSGTRRSDRKILDLTPLRLPQEAG